MSGLGSSSSRGRERGRARIKRVAALVAGSTLALTACFVGLLAAATGQVEGVGSRLPAYVLAMAVAFVATVVRLELEGYDGRPIIVSASGVAVAAFVLVTLGGEGLTYAVRNPEAVVGSQLLLYLLAAGLIGSGLGYWGVRHWREFAEERPGM